MHSWEHGSHAEPAAQGALLWGEDTAVSGWVASGAALFICLSPARQEVRQAKRDPKRRKKKVEGGQNFPCPHAKFKKPSNGKRKLSAAFQSSRLMLGGFQGQSLLGEN